MRLVERQHIRRNHRDYEYCRKITHLSKNLYNAALYSSRQHFFDTKEYKGDYAIINDFTKENNGDYRALPTKVAKQTVRQVHKDFSSFFSLLKMKLQGKYDKSVKIPSYKDKSGYAVVTFPKESIGKKPLYNPEKGMYIHTVCGRDKNFRFSFHSSHKNIDSARIIPKQSGDFFILEVIHSVEEPPLVEDNGRYASIDLGVNNIMSVFFNCTSESMLINGRPVKSINQFYNKKKAKMYGELSLCQNISVENGRGYQNKAKHYDSKRLRKLNSDRNNKINDSLHKITRFLVNHIVSLDVSKVIIGNNIGWKQDIKIGKRNNQTFVGIPHSTIISMLEYKLRLVGIELITTEESYTSKCSALDREKIGKHGKYTGRRIKRGLFRTGDGTLVNADINGAINIMRKVFPDESIYFDGIEDAAVHPRRYNVLAT